MDYPLIFLKSKQKKGFYCNLIQYENYTQKRPRRAVPRILLVDKPTLYTIKTLMDSKKISII